MVRRKVECEHADIKSITSLLEMNLNIPNYQRPYKWSTQNIDELLFDIANSINDANAYGNEFRYRIGTIILHKRTNSIENVYDVVDGQQRIISFLLLQEYIEPGFKCSISEKVFPNKITQYNIHHNYMRIKEWFSLKSKNEKDDFSRALKEILEVVVVCVDRVTEAFQLFDSQNTRGKALDPHDLLKAYHLREMRESPYEMKHAVTKWEAKDMKQIKELFDLYLFPIWHWSRGNKSRPFTTKEIDVYKGIEEGSPYSYAKRTCKAMPYFQITDPFIAGNDFFEMVDHYILLLHDIKFEMCTNPDFKEINSVIYGEHLAKTPEDMDKVRFDSAGFRYTVNLFYCALLYYYDKFHNFDTMAIKKLFSWAFMLRVDMTNLGFDSINKYAIGDDNPSYTNTLGIFTKIALARTHHEISGLEIKVHLGENKPSNEKWTNLYKKIREINGYKDEQ